MPEDVPELGSLPGVVLFVFLAGFESLRPALNLTGDLGRRWIGNLGVYAINTGLLIILGFLGLTFGNVFASAHSTRLFNSLTPDQPAWLRLACAMLVLDLFSYATHWVLHRVRRLWPLHAVHHADVDLDVTTGFRHHPGEFLLAQAFGLGLGLLLGIPAQYWAFYATLANATALIQHANLRWPESVDRAVRTVIVTPGMHRHHHAKARAIHDTNYGTVFSFWDRLFGTYRASDAATRDAQPIGLMGLGTPADQRLDGLLLMPWRLFNRNSP